MWTVVEKDYNGAEKFPSLIGIVVHLFKEFSKDEEVSEINEAGIEMVNNFNLSVDEDNIEKLLQVVPEELINEELFELEQEQQDHRQEQRKLQEKEKVLPENSQ